MTENLTHRDARHFFYQKHLGVFWGSTRLARQALAQVERSPIGEEAFLDYIAAKFPDAYSKLEWVRFHQYDSRDTDKIGFYRLAVMNIAPDPEVRASVFESRARITIDTGWYPLVQGSRLQCTELPFRAFQTQSRTYQNLRAIQSFGNLHTLAPLASGEQEGNSFSLVGSTGSILLDFGTTSPSDYGANFSLAFLSHYHRDHAGGIWNFLSRYSTPIVLSKGTLAYLWSLDLTAARAKEHLAHSALHPEQFQWIDMQDGGRVEFFPVYHSPAAYGIQVIDKQGLSFTYFGDLCLRNGFCDFRDDAYRIVRQTDAEVQWVLLDGAMVGRYESIEEEDSPRALIEALGRDRLRRNVLFVSDQPESLIYSYIYTFQVTTRARPNILLSHQLYSALQALWSPVVLSRLLDTDPVVRSIVGHTHQNFGESQRLYPLNEGILSKLPGTEAYIIFCTPADIVRCSSLAHYIKRSDVVLLGTTALRSEVPPEILAARPRSILRAASPDWSFHSEGDDLALFIRSLSKDGVRVILFHNYPKRLDQFLRKKAIDTSMVKILSKTPVALRSSS